MKLTGEKAQLLAKTVKVTLVPHSQNGLEGKWLDATGKERKKEGETKKSIIGDLGILFLKDLYYTPTHFC